MAPTPSYTIGQTAVLIGKPGPPLPVSTIRNWTTDFADHLSPQANPGSGVERKYNDFDVAVLRLVHEMRTERAPLAAIHERLAHATITPITVMPAGPQPPDEPTTLATTPGPDAPAQLPAGLADLAPHLVAIDHRLQRIEGQRGAILWLLVGLLVGVLVALGAVLVLQVAR